LQPLSHSWQRQLCCSLCGPVQVHLCVEFKEAPPKKGGGGSAVGGGKSRGWIHCLCHLTATKALGLSPATWSKNCVSQVALGAVKQRCRRHKCCSSNAGFHILLLLWSSCNWSGNQQLTKKRCKKTANVCHFSLGGRGSASWHRQFRSNLSFSFCLSNTSITTPSESMSTIS